MKYLVIPFLLMASSVQAACFAEYKAKRGDPLQLHYGIMALGDVPCDNATVEPLVTGRLAEAGWSVLTATPQTTEPTEQQKADAGEFYLRF